MNNKAYIKYNSNLGHRLNLGRYQPQDFYPKSVSRNLLLKYKQKYLMSAIKDKYFFYHTSISNSKFLFIS